MRKSSSFAQKLLKDCRYENKKKSWGRSARFCSDNAESPSGYILDTGNAIFGYSVFNQIPFSSLRNKQIGMIAMEVMYAYNNSVAHP